MKKSILIASVIVASIIVGISSIVLVESDGNSEELNLMDEKPQIDESNKVLVTTTTNVITDLVENIGGDKVQVIGLMGQGVDPHL